MSIQHLALYLAAILAMNFLARRIDRILSCQEGALRQGQRRLLASQAVFNRRLDKLRAQADAEEEEDEYGCQGGRPAPQPIGLQILGETDAAIAEELIRQTGPHRGSRA